jgi:hypothetical protein
MSVKHLGRFLLLLTLLALASSGAADSQATLNVGGASIDVTFVGGDADLPRDTLVEWVRRAAEAVSTYYGHFPAPRARVRATIREGGRGISNATTYSSAVPFTRISVGQHTSREELFSDWTLTHELVHMAFPNMADRHHWLEEGLATYVEPIARAQAGQLNPQQVWAEMVRDMPKGQPGGFDRGLDNTHTWGRTYWGGALFSLVADVRIRECTKNRKGLQDALKAILEESGGIRHDWVITDALQVGDKAVGCSVLVQLYNEMKDTPVHVDLADIWRKLGIEAQGRGVDFRPGPLSAARVAITKPR